jgi:poly-gamma-glutamate synthesis protein (capsule biosynthesis protein)
MWVAYGLGNFISNQGPHAGLSAQTQNGLMLLAHLRKPEDGPVTVDGVEWTAITVDRSAGHRVESLSQAGAAGAGTGTLSAAQVAERRALVAGVAGPAAPELTAPPTPTGREPVVTARPGA